jgi:hypothetical protein
LEWREFPQLSQQQPRAPARMPVPISVVIAAGPVVAKDLDAISI